MQSGGAAVFRKRAATPWRETAACRRGERRWGARAARQAGKAGDRGGSGDFAGDCVRRWRDRDRTCSSRCCVRSGFRRGYFERAPRALDARPRPAMAITWQKLLALELAVTDLGAAPAKSASRTRRARASGRRFFSGPALRRRRRGGDRVGCPWHTAAASQ